MKNWRHFVLPLALLAAAIGLRVAEPSLVQQTRMMVFDTFQRLKPRPYQPMPVRIVAIDDETLERLGQWPWPRNKVAGLVDRLNELGAAVIAFDIIFAEPDRTSPQRVMDLWPESPELDDLRNRLQALPDHDQVFAESIGRASVVTGFGLTAALNQIRPLEKAPVAHAGDDPLPFVPSYGGAVVSLPEIAAAAAGRGSLNIVPEQDGVLRRVSLLMGLDGAIYPSLAAEVVRVAQGAGSFVIKSSGSSGQTALGRKTGINHVKIGAFVVATDPNGRIWNYDSGPVAARLVPAWKIMEPDFDPALLAGHIVLIGTTAVGLKDDWATPLTANSTGIEMHAQVIEQILTGEYLLRPDWAVGAELVFLLVLGLALIVLLPRWGALWCAILAGSAVILTLAGTWAAFDQLRWLFDPIFPAFVILLIYLVESSLIFLRSEAERRHIRKAFSHYLAPSVVERLVTEGRMPMQGGEMRELSVWISDLENYSTYSELLPPTELVTLLNTVYTVISDTVEEHDGFVAQFVGDAVVAVFGAPLSDPAHAQNAVESALACTRRVGELATRMSLPKGLRLHIRVGISTGELLVGNIGSKRRLSYSIVGDDINLASRLEGANKIYGSTLLVNESTVQQCGPELRFREVDVIKVLNREAAVRIFEPLGKPELISADRERDLEAFAAALALFRAREFATAAASFEGLSGSDPVAAAFAARARQMCADPPPGDWDGINVLLAK